MELRPPASDAPPSSGRSRLYGRQVDEDAARGPRCFYGWAVWLVLCVGSIGTFFGTSSAITFVLDDVMSELDLSRSGISAVYMAGTLLGAAAQIPIGRAVDRFGGRRSIAACSAAFALSCVCLSLPRHWATLVLAFGCLRALGFGGLALASTTCLQQWFVRRRGLATGMLEATNSIVGFGLCSALLHALVEAFGWRGAYLRSGVVLLGHAPLAALVLRSRPEDIGLLPDGDAHGGAAGGSASGGSGGGGGAPAIEGWRRGEAMRTAAFWILVSSNALQWGAGAGIFVHLASVARELGLPLARLPSCFYLPWALARAAALLAGGFALDRAPPRLVLGLGFLSGGVSLALLGWPGARLSPGRAVGTGLLYGLSMGFSAAAFKITPARFFGRAHLGAIQGVLQTSNVAATAVGPLLIGGAHDLGAAYSTILLAIAATTAGAGVVCSVGLHTPRRATADPGSLKVVPEPASSTRAVADVERSA